MKLSALTCLFSSVLLFASCSKPNSGDDMVQPTVTTTPPTSITSTGALFGGNITSLGNQTVNSRGVCISTNANPTINDQTEWTGGSGTGPYTLTNSRALAYNTVYHVRAIVQSNTGVAYGDDLTFTTLGAVANTTLAPSDIISKSAILNGNTNISAGTVITGRGFCYKTSPNPTTSDLNVTTSAANGNYSLAINNLTANTTYYVRSYSMDNNGQLFYGNEVSFKTTGYTGASGGVVFYDKGSVTDGWRYMEAGPLYIHYNVALGQGSWWGCAGSFINLTVSDFGKGLENTLRIISLCGNANCAARVCRNYSINGLNDWFLASKDELLLMMNSLPTTHPITSAWSSTELDQNQAYYVYRNLNPTVINSFLDGKANNYHGLWPVRRF